MKAHHFPNARLEDPQNPPNGFLGRVTYPPNKIAPKKLLPGPSYYHFPPQKFHGLSLVGWEIGWWITRPEIISWKEIRVPFAVGVGGISPALGVVWPASDWTSGGLRWWISGGLDTSKVLLVPSPKTNDQLVSLQHPKVSTLRKVRETARETRHDRFFRILQSWIIVDGWNPANHLG